MSKVKLVALDMDGTLLNDKKEAPKSFPEWVKTHPEVNVVIASGRQYFTLMDEFPEIADKLDFIAENGNIIIHKGEVVYVNSMEPEDVKKTVEFARTIPDTAIILCGVKSAYFINPDEEILEQGAIYYHQRMNISDYESVIENEKILKLAIYVKNSQAEAVYNKFPEISDRIESVLSGVSWVDVENRGTNKGDSLKFLMNYYGITPDESMAFGDFLNDISLLGAVEESYCMANGHEELKKLAKHIAPSNNDEGVMQVLRREFD